MAIKQTKIAGGELHGLSKQHQKLLITLVDNVNQAASIDDVSNAIKNSPTGTSQEDLFWRGDKTWAKPNLDNAGAYLDADVTMTLADTYYNGPEITLDTGTWLVSGQAFGYVAGSTNARFSAVLWDGLTPYGSSEVSSSLGSGQIASCSIAGVPPIKLDAKTALKISLCCNLAGAVFKKQLQDNPKGDTASYISAIRLV